MRHRFGCVKTVFLCIILIMHEGQGRRVKRHDDNTACDILSCLDENKIASYIYQDKCYAMRDDKEDWPDNYKKCTKRADEYGLDYGRAAVFTSPIMYQDIMQNLLLLTQGQTTNASISNPCKMNVDKKVWLGAQCGGGLDGTVLSDYCWMSDSGTQGSQVAYSSQNVPVQVTSTTASTICLAVNLTDPNSFYGVTCDQEKLFMVYEYGCGTPEPATCPTSSLDATSCAQPGVCPIWYGTTTTSSTSTSTWYTSTLSASSSASPTAPTSTATMSSTVMSSSADTTTKSSSSTSSSSSASSSSSTSSSFSTSPLWQTTMTTLPPSTSIAVQTTSPVAQTIFTTPAIAQTPETSKISTTTTPSTPTPSTPILTTPSPPTTLILTTPSPPTTPIPTTPSSTYTPSSGDTTPIVSSESWIQSSTSSSGTEVSTTGSTSSSSTPTTTLSTTESTPAASTSSTNTMIMTSTEPATATSKLPLISTTTALISTSPDTTTITRRRKKRTKKPRKKSTTDTMPTSTASTTAIETSTETSTVPSISTDISTVTTINTSVPPSSTVESTVESTSTSVPSFSAETSTVESTNTVTTSTDTSTGTSTGASTVSQTSSVISDATSTATQTSSTVSETSSAAPERSSAVSETSSTVPQTSITVPQSSSTVSQSTTTALGTSSTTLKTPTVPSTTKAPLTSTVSSTTGIVKSSNTVPSTSSTVLETTTIPKPTAATTRSPTTPETTTASKTSLTSESTNPSTIVIVTPTSAGTTTSVPETAITAKTTITDTSETSTTAFTDTSETSTTSLGRETSSSTLPTETTSTSSPALSTSVVISTTTSTPAETSAGTSITTEESTTRPSTTATQELSTSASITIEDTSAATTTVFTSTFSTREIKPATSLSPSATFTSSSLPVDATTIEDTTTSAEFSIATPYKTTMATTSPYTSVTDDISSSTVTAVEASTRTVDLTTIDDNVVTTEPIPASTSTTVGASVRTTADASTTSTTINAAASATTDGSTSITDNTSASITTPDVSTSITDVSTTITSASIGIAATTTTSLSVTTSDSGSPVTTSKSPPPVTASESGPPVTTSASGSPIPTSQSRPSTSYDTASTGATTAISAVTITINTTPPSTVLPTATTAAIPAVTTTVAALRTSLLPSTTNMVTTSSATAETTTPSTAPSETTPSTSSSISTGPQDAETTTTDRATIPTVIVTTMDRSTSSIALAGITTTPSTTEILTVIPAAGSPGSIETVIPSSSTSTKSVAMSTEQQPTVPQVVTVTAAKSSLPIVTTAPPTEAHLTTDALTGPILTTIGRVEPISTTVRGGTSVSATSTTVGPTVPFLETTAQIFSTAVPISSAKVQIPSATVLIPFATVPALPTTKPSSSLTTTVPSSSHTIPSSSVTIPTLIATVPIWTGTVPIGADSPASTGAHSLLTGIFPNPDIPNSTPTVPPPSPAQPIVIPLTGSVSNLPTAQSVPVQLTSTTSTAPGTLMLSSQTAQRTATEDRIATTAPTTVEASGTQTFPLIESGAVPVTLPVTTRVPAVPTTFPLITPAAPHTTEEVHGSVARSPSTPHSEIPFPQGSTVLTDPSDLPVDDGSGDKLDHRTTIEDPSVPATKDPRNGDTVANIVIQDPGPRTTKTIPEPRTTKTMTVDEVGSVVVTTVEADGESKRKPTGTTSKSSLVPTTLWLTTGNPVPLFTSTVTFPASVTASKAVWTSSDISTESAQGNQYKVPTGTTQLRPSRAQFSTEVSIAGEEPRTSSPPGMETSWAQATVGDDNSEPITAPPPITAHFSTSTSSSSEKIGQTTVMPDMIPTEIATVTKAKTQTSLVPPDDLIGPRVIPQQITEDPGRAKENTGTADVDDGGNAVSHKPTATDETVLAQRPTNSPSTGDASPVDGGDGLAGLDNIRATSKGAWLDNIIGTSTEAVLDSIRTTSTGGNDETVLHKDTNPDGTSLQENQAQIETGVKSTNTPAAGTKEAEVQETVANIQATNIAMPAQFLTSTLDAADDILGHKRSATTNFPISTVSIHSADESGDTVNQKDSNGQSTVEGERVTRDQSDQSSVTRTLLTSTNRPLISTERPVITTLEMDQGTVDHNSRTIDENATDTLSQESTTLTDDDGVWSGKRTNSPSTNADFGTTIHTTNADFEAAIPTTNIGLVKTTVAVATDITAGDTVEHGGKDVTSTAGQETANEYSDDGLDTLTTIQNGPTVVQYSPATTPVQLIDIPSDIRNLPSLPTTVRYQEPCATGDPACLSTSTDDSGGLITHDPQWNSSSREMSDTSSPSPLETDRESGNESGTETLTPLAGGTASPTRESEIVSNETESLSQIGLVETPPSEAAFANSGAETPSSQTVVVQPASIQSLLQSNPSQQSYSQAQETTVGSDAPSQGTPADEVDTSMNPSSIATARTTNVGTTNTVPVTRLPPISSTNPGYTSTRTPFFTGISTKNPCDSEWGPYSSCGVTCGSSVRTRQRRIPGNFTGECTVESETEICDLPICTPMSKVEQIVTNVMMKVGCIWILAGLGCSILAFCALRSRYYLQIMQLNEDISLFAAHLLVLFLALRNDKKFSRDICKATSLALQYFFCATYTFQALEAFHIFTVLTNVVIDNNVAIGVKTALALGWGLPAVVTTITGVTSYNRVMSAFSCWINLGDRVSLATFVPVILIACSTLVLLEATGQWSQYTRSSTTVSCTVARVGLAYVFTAQTASWLMSSMAVYYQHISLFSIVFGFNFTLGIFIFVYHFFSNEKARSVVRRLYNRITAK